MITFNTFSINQGEGAAFQGMSRFASFVEATDLTGAFTEFQLLHRHLYRTYWESHVAFLRQCQQLEAYADFCS